MKSFIEYLAKRLVDNPDLVQVNEVVGETTSVYELRVGEGDLGKVIGKHGHTLRALRTILSGVATKENRRIVLEILE
jgi:predicted RNA-binding protein YlqC (UPF0109 family)